MPLRINEIFHSIQGESTHAGRPCVFVRLTYCHLRCRWCDTEYAFYEGRWMGLDRILAEVAAFGCPPESWRAGGDAFAALMRFQASRAREFYRKAEALDRLLSADGRAIYRVMCGTYRGLLAEIERGGFDVFARRVRVPRWKKGLILLGGWAAKLGWV